MIEGNGNSPFIYSEAKFAEVSGLSRGDAKYLRDQALEQDKHWQRLNGQIGITLAGIKRIWQRLEKKPPQFNLADCLISNGGKKTIALAALNAPRTMRVTQVPINDAIVTARDKLGQNYTVRRARGFFYVGLEILAEPDAQPGLWRAVGPLPRFPGDRGYKPVIAVSEKK